MKKKEWHDHLVLRPQQHEPLRQTGDRSCWNLAGIPHYTELPAVWINLMNEVRNHFNLPPIKIEFSRLAGWRLDDVRAGFGRAVLLFCDRLGDRGSFTIFRNHFFSDACGITIERWVGKEAGGRTCVVDDIEPELAVVMAP